MSIFLPLLVLTAAVLACVRLETSRSSNISTGMSTERYDLVFKLGPARFIIGEYVSHSGVSGTHSHEELKFE